MLRELHDYGLRGDLLQYLPMFVLVAVVDDEPVPASIVVLFTYWLYLFAFVKFI